MAKTNIRIINDTAQKLTVRINIADTLPTVKIVEPQKAIAVFMATNNVLLKVWDRNTILLQDKGES